MGVFGGRVGRGRPVSGRVVRSAVTWILLPVKKESVPMERKLT
jgi:hypothetical protein